MSSAPEAASLVQPNAAMVSAPAPASTYSHVARHSVASSSASLYVAELDPTVTEATLFEIFNKIGPIASIRVCRNTITRRSLGYAHVNYLHAADSQRALEQLNYSLIKNRPCRIMRSHCDPALRKTGQGNIFIKNLDVQIDDEALHDTFAAFGKVLSCKVATDARGRSKGYGFVLYETPEIAETAIRTANGMLLNDKKISVCHYIYRNERRSKAEMRAHFIDAYIKNIDSSPTKEEFEAPFQQFNDIPDSTKDVSVGSPTAIVAEEGDDPSGTIQTAPEAAVQPSRKSKDESEPCSLSISETPIDFQPKDVKPELAKDDLTFASPIAEKFAPEWDIPLSGVRGADSEGRIPYEGAEKQQPPVVAPATAEYVDIPIPNMHEVVGARLTHSKQELPYHYLTVEINMDEILKLREVFNRTLGEKGKTARLSVNDFILKAVACALADVPEANSAWLGEVIRRYNTADISMAVATPTGLITPIIKNVGSKGIATISVEAEALAKKARDGRLTPQECQGGTFTVSNLGMFDIDQFTAIINPAQSCNLAVGSMKPSIISSPEEERGFKTVNIMKVTLCSDHRVVDSAIGAHWMSAFKGYLENPLTLML